MKLRLFKKDYIEGIKEPVGYDYIIFDSKYFSFKWFTDCGEWFIYITIFKIVIRFSSAGNMIFKRQ